MEWQQERGGLHKLVVDDIEVAVVERGAETRKWYFTAIVHGEESCGRRDTMSEAMQAAEEKLAQA